MTYHQIGVAHPDDAFEELTAGDIVTGHRIVVDGDSDKEVTVRDSRAGASSVAPSSSGIPSAVTQNGDRMKTSGSKTTETSPMAGRVQPHEAHHTP